MNKYSQIEENIFLFESQQIELPILVQNLEFLISSMQAVDKKWQETLLDELSTLETISAIHLIEHNENTTLEVDKIQMKKQEANSIMNIKNLIKLANNLEQNM